VPGEHALALNIDAPGEPIAGGLERNSIQSDVDHNVGSRPVCVLCFDIEGGYGGSSRSLYYSIKHMPVGAVQAEVWCRKAGPIQSAYGAIGVVSKAEPTIFTATAIARLSRTLVDMGRAVVNLVRNRKSLRQWGRDIDRRFDVVHFNHEGLAPLAAGLRRYCRVPFTFHIRRLPPAHFLARLQLSMIARLASQVICISEGEATAYRKYGNSNAFSVIHNIVEIDEADGQRDSAVLAMPGMRIASLANYSWARGVDQLVDVARELKARGRENDFRFVLMGNLEFVPSLPEERRRFGNSRTSVAAFARDAKVAHMFHFVGSVPNPASILAACDMLAKPARRDLPWGRDVLEAMAAGKPVVTTGTDATFVETNVTGMLLPRFDARTFADALVELARDGERRQLLGANAKRRVEILCDPTAQADALLNVWRLAARREMDVAR
jgi:glycosyltransferase involved in cell wall biosynthesis